MFRLRELDDRILDKLSKYNIEVSDSETKTQSATLFELQLGLLKTAAQVPPFSQNYKQILSSPVILKMNITTQSFHQSFSTLVTRFGMLPVFLICETLGECFTASSALHEALEAFTCTLYDQSQCKGIHIARANLFKKGKCSEWDLPPNLDSLNKHIQQANYQAAVHRRSLEANPKVPSPLSHGWKLDGQAYEVEWMTLPPAPDAILELVHCSCKKTQCKTARCTCRLHDLPCTNVSM